MKRKKQSLIVDSPIAREEAEWMASVESETGRRMVEYLKASTDVRRPIDSLSKLHLSGLAEIARATWVNAVYERKADLKANPPSPELSQQMDWLLV